MLIANIELRRKLVRNVIEKTRTSPISNSWIQNSCDRFIWPEWQTMNTSSFQ